MRPNTDSVNAPLIEFFVGAYRRQLAFVIESMRRSASREPMPFMPQAIRIADRRVAAPFFLEPNWRDEFALTSSPGDRGRKRRCGQPDSKRSECHRDQLKRTHRLATQAHAGVDPAGTGLRHCIIHPYRRAERSAPVDGRSATGHRNTAAAYLRIHRRPAWIGHAGRRDPEGRPLLPSTAIRC